MSVDARNILDQLNNPDDDFLRSLIDEANPQVGVSKLEIGAQIYLARTLISASNKLENAIDNMIESNESSLAAHAEALINSAKASEKYSKSLNLATWFLGFTTLALTIHRSFITISSSNALDLS